MNSLFVPLRDGLRLYCAEYPARQTVDSRPPILCVAGLTRNSRDYEALAPWLAQEYRVLAIDLRGRGQSDHDPDWRRYRLDVYVEDVRQLLESLGIDRLIMVGTSLGGLLGLQLGCQSPPELAALVLNDIGPELDPAGMQRIASSVGTAQPATTWQEAARQLAAGHQSALPDFTADDWLQFAKRLCRERAPGVIERDMDKMIGRALRESGSEIPDFWQAYCAQGDKPMLVLRGEHSDLLSLQTLQRMRSLRPSLEAETIARRGHTPTLDESQSRRILAGFLDEHFGSDLLASLA